MRACSILGAERRSPARSRVKFQGVAQVVAQPRALRQRRANLLLQLPERRGRCLDRLAVAAANHHEQPVSPGRIKTGVDAREKLLGADRHDDVEAPAHVGSKEAFGCHTDDSERRGAQCQRLADDIGRAAEMSPPEFVADDRGRAFSPAAPPIVIDRKRAAERSAHAEYSEEIAACANDADELQLPAAIESEPCGSPGERAIESVGPAANLLPDRVAPGARWIGRIDDEPQLLGVGDRQRPQHQAVDQREDRCARTNSERQRQHCRNGHDRSGDQSTQCDAGCRSWGLRRKKGEGPLPLTPFTVLYSFFVLRFSLHVL